jgi:hypothetical protein
LLGTTVDDLDFATAEGRPDLLRAVLADHRELWLFGETTTEVFFHSDSPDFPFERIPSGFLETGIAAKFSACRCDNTSYWLAADEHGFGTVVRADGYRPVRISTHAVETDIANIAKTSRIDDAVAYSYEQEGHKWYILTFPSGNRTWAYDVATGLWFKRSWRNPATNARVHQRQWVHMFFAGLNIVGDRINGNLYVLDLDTYTDNGDPISRLRRCPHVCAPGEEMLFFASLQILMESGVGLTAGQGSDPKMMLRISNDGGKTWVSELHIPFGKVGEYRRRAIARKLGKARDRVYEVEITDPVKVAIIDAVSDAKVGR